MDVIILSNGLTNDLQQITQNAIDSCVRDDEVKLVIVKEQQEINYKDCLTVHENITTAFNYNKELNILAQRFCKGAEYIAFCNNDLIFDSDWASVIIDYMKKNDVVSCSPIRPRDIKKKIPFKNNSYYREGCIMGWCLVLEKNFYFNVLKGFSEEYKFHSADDMYGKQLTELGIKHHFCKDSIVEHLEGKTTTQLKMTNPVLVNYLTTQESIRFYNNNGGWKNEN
jgi:GT2 family glycosyltransferase